MSLVRIPRLWEKRHYFHEWKTLNENRDLSEKDALELFDHEERRWNLYEDELRNQYANRQATLVNQINQLDSYIFNTLSPSADPFYVDPNEGGGKAYNAPQWLREEVRGIYGDIVQELITEDGIYFVVEDGNVVGPYLGA
tara:strand:- start:7 stop:426 length:420 start_codon:yes stop_codon:yes gene_type:complete